MCDAKLTRTEAGAQRLINLENKMAKCKRCCGREDKEDGSFECYWGENAKDRMADIKTCPLFMLNERREEWLE